MPNMRGSGIPFILTRPWQLPRIPVDSTPTVIRDFPVGIQEQLSRFPTNRVYARSYRTKPAVVGAALTPRRVAVSLATTRQVPLPSSERRQPFLFYTPPARRTAAASRPWWLSFRSTRRPPAVTATAVVSNFPVGLSIQLVSRKLRRVATKSVFRPPVVVGAATTFLPSPKRIQLARWQNAWYRIGLARPPVPTIVNPAAPVFPSRANLAPGFLREARRAHSVLRPPTVVTAPIGDVRNVPVSIQVQLFRWPPYPRKVTRRVSAPTFTASATPPTLSQLRPRVTLAKRVWGVQPTRSTLRPPTVTAAPAVNFPVGIAIQLVARKLRRVTTKSVLRPPTVLGYYQAKTRVQLAYWRAPAAGKSSLRPPTVLGFYRAKPNVKLAYWRTPPTGKSTLRPPIVVGSGVVTPLSQLRPTIRTRPKSWAVQPTHSTLRPPVVVAAASATSLAQLRLTVKLAPRGTAVQPARSKLRAPTVVIPASGTIPVRVELAPRGTAVQPTHSKLRPPIVVQSAATLKSSVRITFAAAPGLSARPSRYSVRGPVVLATPTIPLRIKLVRPLPPQVQGTRVKFRPPAPFTASTLKQRTITVRLSPRVRALQPTRSRLFPPSVVAPAPTVFPSGFGSQRLADRTAFGLLIADVDAESERIAEAQAETVRLMDTDTWSVGLSDRFPFDIRIADEPGG